MVSLTGLLLVTGCSECEPSTCTDGVAIQFVGTGPDAGLLAIQTPFTVTLEIHDSDGQVVSFELLFEEGHEDPDFARFDRRFDFGPFDLRMGQPEGRDAVARTLHLEIESEDWYGAQTFELDYVETSECCSIASHSMDFQPKRDLP